MVQGRKMANYDPYQILDFNTSLERYLSKLSENPKIFDMGPTVLKLGQMKEFVNFGPIPWIIYSPWSKAEKYQN